VTYPIQPIQTILSAVVFAAQKHSNQRRMGAAAEPFIEHLIEVAALVAGALSEPDTNLVIAALLHDTMPVRKRAQLKRGATRRRK
jgi:(p)ppGpp synthase/HD superfamily hydrolase